MPHTVPTVAIQIRAVGGAGGEQAKRKTKQDGFHDSSDEGKHEIIHQQSRNIPKVLQQGNQAGKKPLLPDED